MITKLKKAFGWDGIDRKENVQNENDPSPEDEAIKEVIDQIWYTYDIDKSGELDKEETKKFVQDTLENLGSGDEFSHEAFDEVFATFDEDDSGTVEKLEMVTFIKQLLGGNSERDINENENASDQTISDNLKKVLKAMKECKEVKN